MNVPAKKFTVGDHVVNEGDVVSIDGTTGRSTSVRCRSCRPRWCSTSRANSTRRTPTTRWSAPYTGS
ncbi:hypothetical protein V2I01_04360 [Micromonospora sp. BRA006-A]|nr:hypothetical protein [Micromonospora sp. BRA006-A]